MARTSEAKREYDRRYRAEHREEISAKHKQWLAAHADQERERVRRTEAARRAHLNDDYAEARRIERNLLVARRAGLDEFEAWQVVMLAERERQIGGATALYGGRFQQLIADRLAARLRVEKWRAPEADEWPAIDAGWGLEEAV